MLLATSSTCTQNIVINTIAAPFRGVLVTFEELSPIGSPLPDIVIPNREMFYIPWDLVLYDNDPDPFYTESNPTILKVPAGVSKIRLSANFRFENLTTDPSTIIINDESFRFIYIVKVGDPSSLISIASTQATAFDPGGFIDVPAGIDRQQLQTSLNVTSPILKVVPGEEFQLIVYQNALDIALDQDVLSRREFKESWFSIEVIE